MTRRTLILHIQLDFLLTAKNGLLKGDADAGTQIGSLHRTSCPAAAPSATAKQIAENIAENIAHISTEIEAVEAACSAATLLKRRMAKLVILSALIRITQNGIRLGCLLKLLLCFLVARIHIRMIFLCQGTVRLFQCCVICILIHTQDFVVIPLILCHNSSTLYGTMPLQNHSCRGIVYLYFLYLIYLY